MDINISLKLKDNIDFKELYKYGFEHTKGSKTWQLNLEQGFSNRIGLSFNKICISIFEEDRVVEICSLNGEYSSWRLGILFIMFQDGLLEIVPYNENRWKDEEFE